MRITILTHYFPPEVGAAQTRLYELARLLQGSGDTVTVVTAFPNYPDGVVREGYRHRRFMQERMDGIRVIRTWTYAAKNRGFLKRILNHISFSLSAYTALPRLGPTDMIYVQSPPLFIGIAALGFSRFKRAPYIFNVSDLWPETAIQLGALKNRLAIWLAERFERHLYRRAARVTGVTPGIVAGLLGRGVPEKKVLLITNGVDTSAFQPGPADPALARKLGVEGKTVLLYAGNHGLSQGLDVILETARLTQQPDLVFLMVGDGADKDALMARAQAAHLDNVRFLPSQPREAMPGLLNLAYASIVPLRKLAVFKSALPSKMFESMAAARPLIAGLWGEGADVVREARCGIVVEPEDAQAMHDAVLTLLSDPHQAREMGERGRQYAVEHFDRARIVGRLRTAMLEVAEAQ